MVIAVIVLLVLGLLMCASCLGITGSIIDFIEKLGSNNAQQDRQYNENIGNRPINT
jgi:hypothetical protein